MYIAHKNKFGNIQSVSEHLDGTCRKSRKYTENMNLMNIAELQSILHDIGKLCDDFNNYINGNSEFRRGDIDHSYAGARYLAGIADEMGKEYYAVSRFIAHTIISHHGLHDWYDDEGHDYFKKRIGNDKNYSEIINAFEKIYDKQKTQYLLKQAFEEYNHIRSKINGLCKESPKSQKRAFYLGMFERLMQSVLIDADRTDTADFMSENDTEKIYQKDDYKRIWNEMHCRLEDKLMKFAEKTDAISMQRRSISDRCRDFAKNDVKICRLIVPTGGGKTLSSFRFAINYCMEHDKEKIFYIAPFMSILEQNSDEIRSIASEEHFIEHHSNALNEIKTTEELAEYELRTEKWDSPVIAATMVQFLNSLFSGKTSAVRRMHRLCNSVIIIDEVQSVPVKCINMFNLAMNFLSEICGCTVVLCSATQPVFENTDYPMIIDEKESMTDDYSEDFKIFERTNIIPAITEYGMTYDETAEFCRNEYEKAGNLLLVVNTKSAAKTLYEKMQEMSYSSQPEIIHLSTNMCPLHRKEVIENIRTHLDKPVICITTQLIEAGVDISFKCVVRSLAGLDNIVQAAGRCNRHGENDELCPVYIVDIKDEKLSSLYDIERARNISRNIIADYHNCDYTSPEMLKVYYKKLFAHAKDEMNYKYKNDINGLVMKLSLNKDWFTNGSEAVKANEYLAQAFKTAGDMFDVIDAATEGILVPYNEEAADIINELESDIKPDRAAELLRMSQKYTINVYPGQKRALESEGAVIHGKSVIYLKGEFYDKKLGVNTKGNNMAYLGF